MAFDMVIEEAWVVSYTSPQYDYRRHSQFSRYKRAMEYAKEKNRDGRKDIKIIHKKVTESVTTLFREEQEDG